MQKLQPLAFVPVRAPARHVFHPTSIHQTGFHTMLFQHFVWRNPVHSRALHRHRRNAATHQPPRHCLQVFGKRRKHSNWIFIPVRRHGYKDLPGTDIDAARIRLQKWPILQAHPFSSSLPFSFARSRRFLARLGRILIPIGHSPVSFYSGNGQVAQTMYSLNRNQPGVPPQAVTTVWRPELGTTLLIGFNSTTAVSAYFRSWVFPVSLKPPHRAKFLTSMAPPCGHPASNSPCLNCRF